MWWVIFSTDEFFHWQTSRICQKRLHKCWLISSESESSQHYWMSETSKCFPTLFSKCFSSQWSATEEWFVYFLSLCSSSCWCYKPFVIDCRYLHLCWITLNLESCWTLHRKILFAISSFYLKSNIFKARAFRTFRWFLMDFQHSYADLRLDIEYWI